MTHDRKWEDSQPLRDVLSAARVPRAARGSNGGTRLECMRSPWGRRVQAPHTEHQTWTRIQTKEAIGRLPQAGRSISLGCLWNSFGAGLDRDAP
jgi:hypothetical protein